MIRKYFDTKAAREDAAIAGAAARYWKTRSEELSTVLRISREDEDMFRGLWLSAEDELRKLKENA